MSERAHIQFRGQEENLVVSREAPRRTCFDDLNSVYQLSFLLTRDHEKAERCFVVGLEHLVRGNRGFNQWAHAWSKRIVVENAIREVKPRPRVARPYASAIVFPYGAQLSIPPGGHFELEAILALEDFERFVFVLSVLDHYSERDCALFLDCSVLEIREARTRAVEKLIDSLHIVFSHNEVSSRRRNKVTHSAQPVLTKSRLYARVLAMATLPLFAVAARGQYTSGIGTTSSSATSQSSAASVGVTGSVPSGQATNEVLHLTLRDAITRALRYNLATIESGENARIARGERLLALSKLLPQVSAGVSEHVEQINLATFGLKLPGVPSVIGPYSYSSVDANLSQTLFSFESIQRFRAARTAEQAAQLTYNDVLDVVTLAVGNAYLQVTAANSRIDAQEAQVRNARALYDQAADEVQAGTAPRIDLTRTEVQLHTEEYNLSVSRNNFDIAKLDLSRAIGLPLGQEFDLADQLPYSDINPPSVDDALKLAYRSRSDLRAALSSEKAAGQTLSAAKGERFPVIAANGGYGDVGSTFGQSHGDFTFQAGVNVPIFTGGRIKGDITQAEAQLRQRRAEAENIRGQIDYDVRAAFLNLNAAKQQVEVAKQNVSLANESLARSKDRFTSGVTDTVEVVQAEQALASANDQYITSLYNHSLGKLSLARALGVARTNYERYLGGK